MCRKVLNRLFVRRDSPSSFKESMALVAPKPVVVAPVWLNDSMDCLLEVFCIVRLVRFAARDKSACHADAQVFGGVALLAFRFVRSGFLPCKMRTVLFLYVLPWRS